MKNAYKIMENSLKNKGNIIFKDKLQIKDEVIV